MVVVAFSMGEREKGLRRRERRDQVHLLRRGMMSIELVPWYGIVPLVLKSPFKCTRSGGGGTEKGGEKSGAFGEGPERPPEVSE